MALPMFCLLPGTRIIYDRKFLMECRNSPVTKTPPRDLPTIPGVTSPATDEPPTEASQNHQHSSPEDKPAGGEWQGLAGLSLGSCPLGDPREGRDGDCPTLCGAAQSPEGGVGMGAWQNFHWYQLSP